MNHNKIFLYVVFLLTGAACICFFYFRGLSVDPDSGEAVADVSLLRATLNPEIPQSPCRAEQLPGIITRAKSHVGLWFHISVNGHKLISKEGTYTKHDDDTWKFQPFVPKKSDQEITREIDEKHLGKELSGQLHQIYGRRKKTYLEFEEDKTEYIYQKPSFWPGNFGTSEREFRSMAPYAHLALYNQDSQLVAAFPYKNSKHLDWYFHPSLPVLFFSTSEYLSIWDLYSFKEIAHFDAKGDKRFPVATSFTPDASIIAVAQGDQIQAD